jgi:uncharacterized membrane protein YgaE (UPF0421/DUF939 family)
LATQQQNLTSIEHAARTAVAATSALLVARQFGFPEAYWAPITTIVVLQSTLGATLAISTQRIVGTALGAALGAALASSFHTSLIAFGAAVFVAGVICGLLRLHRSAYRYAGITVAIMMLITRNNNVWIIAVHRFAEVSLGIVVGLILTALWPERTPMETPKT